MKITAKEFNRRTLEDPNWCAQITQPTEVTGFVSFTRYEITSLSPLLTFSGKDELGRAADFRWVTGLKIAEGTFHGHADFLGSRIEEIGDLKVLGSSVLGHAASFSSCKWLKIARGGYYGAVSFQGSGIEEIGDLQIFGTTQKGVAALFTDCEKLEIGRGTYPGGVNFNGSNIKRIQDMVVHAPSQLNNAVTCNECPKLERIRGTFNGNVNGPDAIVEEYYQHLNILKAKTHQASEPTLEL